MFEPYQWHSNGLIHRVADRDDWLCVRLDQQTDITHLHLADGTHHYFKALYVLDPHSGVEVADPLPLLHSPGPWDIDLSREDIRGTILLVQVRFLAMAGFHRLKTNRLPIDCGYVAEGENQEPLIAVITSDRTGQTLARSPGNMREAFAYFMGTPRICPRAELREAPQPNPFRLKQRLPSITEVYLLRDENLPPAIVPGAEISMLSLPHLPHIAIPKDVYTPATNIPPAAKDWQLALPILVLDRDKSRGVVGTPFPRGPLISDLLPEHVGPDMWLSWNWHAPTKWLTVKLAWSFHLVDPEWLRELPESEHTKPGGSTDIHWPAYEKKGGINLLRLPEEAGTWELRVSATPFLLRSEMPAHRLELTVLL